MDDDEEGEYIPRTTSEKSNDHVIDENVESEVIVYHNQQSSQDHQSEEADDKPGFESESDSKDQEMINNTQKSMISQ